MIFVLILYFDLLMGPHTGQNFEKKKQQKTFKNLLLRNCLRHEKVKVGNDQETAQSESNSHSKKRGVGKKPNRQLCTYTKKTHRESSEQLYGPRASSAPTFGLNTIIFKHVYWYIQQISGERLQDHCPLVYKKHLNFFIILVKCVVMFQHVYDKCQNVVAAEE